MDNSSGIQRIKVSSEEYAAIKAEIIAINNAKVSYIIAMHTIVVAIIGLGLDSKLNSPFVFLVPYIILFTFQRIIANENYKSLRLSAYLAVFGADGWEKHYSVLHSRGFTPTFDKISLVDLSILRIPSLYLGFISSLICFVVAVKMPSMIAVIVSPCLFVLLALYVRQSLSGENIREKYIQGIKDLLVAEKIRTNCHVKDCYILRDKKKKPSVHILKDKQKDRNCDKQIALEVYVYIQEESLLKEKNADKHLSLHVWDKYPEKRIPWRFWRKRNPVVQKTDFLAMKREDGEASVFCNDQLDGYSNLWKQDEFSAESLWEYHLANSE